MSKDELLTVEELVVDDSSEPLAQQARAFCRTITDNEPPVVSAAHGLAAVRVAGRIVDSIKNWKWDGKMSDRQGLDVLKKD